MARPRPAADYPVEANFTTHVFKIINGVEITLRIWPGHLKPTPQPWILYAHGGAWGFGKNQLPNAWCIPAFRPLGYHFVSLGYRKIPQVWIEDIMEDALDAWKWCRDELPALLPGQVDIDRYVLAGESAGGHVAMLLANRLSATAVLPPPKAVVSCYGPTDLIAGLGTGYEVLGWFPSGEFSQEELEAHIRDRNPSHAVALCPEEFNLDVETLREQWQDPSVVFNRRLRLQYETTKFLTTSGRLMEALLRLDEVVCEEDRKRRAQEYSPLHSLDSTKSYPPTYFLHGTGDLVVKWETHLRPFHDKLKARGIKIGVSLADGVGHGFDNAFTSRDHPGWKLYVDPAVRFVDSAVRQQ